jgi:hypothetical protein
MRWWKSASQTGKIAERKNLSPEKRWNLARHFRHIDGHRLQALHSFHNLQAREAGKAVRFGRGPATVIGPKGRKPGYPPAPQFAELLARGSCVVGPMKLSGLFYFRLAGISQKGERLRSGEPLGFEELRPN